MTERVHSIYIEHWHPNDTYDAGCSCGWESVEWEDEELAQDAADRHIEEVDG